MSTAEKHLQVVQGGGLQQYSREQIDTIKRTVAKGVTDAELEMFLTLCVRYQLDPFLKEIWCYKRQKKGANGKYEDDPNAPAIIMTSRDGYLKVAQRDKAYEGLKSFVVREGDEFEVDAISDSIKHKFGAKRGKILGAWGACYHKDRKPVICFVEFSEYNSGGNVWSKHPSAMIQKVAEAFVLKRQFGISGLVTQEEIATDFVDIDARFTNEKEEYEPQAVADARKDFKAAWKAKAQELAEAAHAAGVDKSSLAEIAQAVVDQGNLTKLTLGQMDMLIAYFEDAQKNGEEVSESESDAPGDDESSEAESGEIDDSDITDEDLKGLDI